MWRYLAGGVAALAMAGAGVLLFGRPSAPAALPAAPAEAAAGQESAAPLPDRVPEASPRTREQKRFGRYDKDKDGAVSREEYLASRRKAYAKLDTNRDGQLSFDEWAAKTSAKFAAADADKSGSMTAAEFATTAVKRKPARRAAPCPPAPTSAEAEES
jgi:hypothetical protein